MNGSNFMQGWVALTGSLAMIALILTAFGLMLGIVKPADALRRVAAILGIVIASVVIPGCPCKPLVGHVPVATARSGRDWDSRLAVAATATATTKKQGGMKFQRCGILVGPRFLRLNPY